MAQSNQKGKKQVHSSTSSCLCFISLIMCIFLPVPKALGNICVLKSSSAGFCVSEAAPGQLGEIVDYHKEKEEQWLCLGYSSRFLSSSFWWNTRSYSPSYNFWSLLSQSIVPDLWMCRALDSETLTFWVTAVGISQNHKIFLHKIFWKVIYVIAHKIILSWCGAGEVCFLQYGWGTFCALKDKNINPAFE